MFLYKILGFLLLSSPVTFLTESEFFPYSYLGITLIFLITVLFESNKFLIVDWVFWLFITFSILLYKPISYKIMFHCFLLYHHLCMITEKQYIRNNYLLLLGILCVIVGLFIPSFVYGGIGILILSSIIVFITNKYHKRQQVRQSYPIELEAESEEIIQEHLDQFIPYEDNDLQEQEYVIPKD